MYVFGLPILLFSILLVLRLQWVPQLNLFLVFIPLWFMDSSLPYYFLSVVMLTIFLLGPTVIEVIKQSVMRNIRGILDVDLIIPYK